MSGMAPWTCISPAPCKQNLKAKTHVAAVLVEGAAVQGHPGGLAVGAAPVHGDGAPAQHIQAAVVLKGAPGGQEARGAHDARHAGAIELSKQVVCGTLSKVQWAVQTRRRGPRHGRTPAWCQKVVSYASTSPPLM